MNSDKKIYEQLLKYHPEFKDSKEDIKQAISHLQKVNPDIKVNQVFADKLKDKLQNIAEYQSEKKKTWLWFLSFLIPVFSFWFAVFWFWYLSDDLISPDENFHEEIQPIEWAAPAMLQMKMWDVQNENLRMMWNPQADDMSAEDSMDMQAETFMVESFMDEISDDFMLWCEDNSWEVSILHDQSRVCTLSKSTCLEVDFYDGNCISQDK